MLAVAIGFACPAIGRQLQLVSTPDPAQAPPAGGGGDSWAPIISPDGRYVLFASTANNLMLASNTNPLLTLLPPRMNVFLRDRTNGTTTLVSVNLSGTGGGNGNSWPSALSTNARFGLFESSASDPVSSDTNGLTDVFIRDLAAGTTLLVSVSTNGGSANGASRSSVMTPDGRYVAFVSEASNLVPGDTNGIADVFVRDVQMQATTLASVGARSVSPPSNSGITASTSELPDITPDGRYVAFYSTAGSLVAGVQTVGDIYVRDLVGGTTVWASSYARTAVQSILGVANAVCFNHALSDDGQFVAYEARPTPVSSTAAAGLILRYSLQTGFTDLAHTNANVSTGTAYEDVHNLDMTPDGRFIAFIANTNGTSGATTCAEVWDAQTGTATLASGDVSNNVPAGSICDWPALDTSGRFVAFLSSATNVVTNLLAGDYHLYVRDMQAGATTLVDSDTNGVGSPISPATAPRLSADGRLVAFECPDASLVPNDRNRAYDAFVRDLATGAGELISARNPALPCLTPNGSSMLSMLSVSADGRYIAFASDADNLVPNDTNRCQDIFVRDLLASTNTLVSVATNGVAGDGLSAEAAISSDGRYVAFSSSADNLVANDTNKAQDVFVRDLQAGTTALVSVNTAGSGPGNGNSYSPWVSADGRFVLFHSQAPNLAAGSFTAGYEYLFLRDLQLGTNYALTHTSSGTRVIPVDAMTPDGRFVAFYGTLAGYSTVLGVWDSLRARLVYSYGVNGVLSLGVSPDGNRIAYTTTSGLFVVDRLAGTNGRIGASVAASRAGLRFSSDGPPGATNQVYLYDFQGGTNLLVSRGYTASEPGNGSSDSPDISADGRFVAYRSAATNLVPGGTNGLPHIFLYDRQNSTTTLLSASRLGPWAADNQSLTPVFSGDGQTLVFQSWASDLFAQDFNQGSEGIAYSLYASGSIPLFSASLLPGTIPGQGPWITWPVLPGKAYTVEV
jgi:Tol biopolymer transport system component